MVLEILPFSLNYNIESLEISPEESTSPIRVLKRVTEFLIFIRLFECNYTLVFQS